MEKENKKSYSEAIAEIEAILDSLNGGDYDVDKLAGEVKKAAGLIAMCRERLRVAEAEVAEILKEKEQ